MRSRTGFTPAVMGQRANGFAGGRTDVTGIKTCYVSGMVSGFKFGRWRATVTGLAVSTAVGAMLGVIGPFGSYLNGSPPVRIAYWVACLWVGWLSFGVTLPILTRWAKARGVSAWVWMAPAVAVLTVMPAILSRLLAVRLWPVVERVGYLEWYGQGLVISALATVVMAALVRSPAAEKSDPQSADPRERLPYRIGRTVRCLQVEDHYVRVHTSQGSALVLMSLTQAIAGLEDIEGAQTHRSWWVARDAVVGVVEDGRNTRLRLVGGLEPPVSRARVGALRDKGWLSSSHPGGSA